MMKTNQNNHIMNMNKGMKQKLSMLLIACLLFTGYRGLTIPGRAEQGNTEQNNEISVSGTQVKVQLLGEDLRRAAKEAIEKGERVDDSVLKGYSKDEELQKSYAGIFSLDKEVYEIPLDSISEGLSESLAEEEAGLQVFVERDAQDLDNLVRKESKESLLLYDGKSQLEQLFPKGEETETAKKEEEESLASDSNLVRNTELTGSELITFLYKNKADHRITFQLSVDGNKYPKVTVSPKTQLFKELVDKLKKEEKKVPVETAKVPESKIEESTEAKSTASEEQLAESVRSSEEVKETAVQAASKEETTVSSVTEASSQGSASKVSIVSEEKKEETSKQETSEATVKAEEKQEESAEAETASEAPVKKESTKEVAVKFSGFLQDVISHYEEFLGELVSARFSQYSLNELGRKSQNVEIEGFATVEVFYDDEAFVDEEGKAEEVVLEANRLVKPEEEGKKEGEKLTEEQVEAMKEHSIYEGSDALDIRFVSKNDRTKEVEPKVPVSVRLTFDKKAVPEEATADTIAIHHIVEDKNSGKVKYVETVLRSELEKRHEKEELKLSEGPKEEALPEKATSEEFKKVGEKKEEAFSKEEENKENITKEFTVDSFSAYIVRWTRSDWKVNEIRFHYVDRNFREIAPTKYTLRNDGRSNQLYYDVNDVNNKIYASLAYKAFPNYDLQWVGYQNGPIYSALPELKDGEYVYYITSNGFKTAKRINNQDVPVASYDFNVTACVHDFYFIYRLNYCNAKTPNNREITPDLFNEKYITDKQDGTYELTLTGQVKPQAQKQKLDIAFVYDNTAVMATDFNFSGKTNKLGTEDYATNPDNAKSSKVKSEIKAFMKKLSSNPDYDVRYALVTMDGDKSFGNIDENAKAKYDQSYLNTQNYQNISHMKGGPEGDINLVGDYRGDKNGVLQFLENSTDDDGKSHGFNVTDTPYNDTKHLYGFTDRPDQIVNQLDALDEKKAIANNRVSGENYESAIRNVKVLLGQSGNYQVASGGLVNENNKARSDAQKIVIFIAGGNPKLSYIVADGVYEDTHRFNDSDYYMIRRNYSQGWSFGNGYSVDFAALNRARGEIHSLTAADAFYSIGVGKKENWNYLNDFAMGQYYDEDGNHRTHENYDETKHPDRREKALVDNIRYKCFDASQESGLSSALQQIYEREAGNQVKNIVIRDVLTENVQPIPQNKTAVKGQLVKMKPNGNKEAVEVAEILDSDGMAKLGLNGFTITAEKTTVAGYSGKRWVLTLKTDPEDFSLPAGYDIRMVATIEPTESAKSYLKTHSTYPDEGQERTDLNRIYQVYLGKDYRDPKGKPDSMFNTSYKKNGLFTNEEADITYKTRKPNGSESTPPAKKYNKPIINLKNTGFLQIKKIFWGVDNKIYNSSTGRWTELGKQILKNISFEIWQKESSDTRDEEGGRLLTTINLGDEDWINGDFTTDKVLKKNGFDLRIHAYERKDDADYFIFTIDNLPKNMRYKVVEKVANESKIYQENATDLLGYKFVGKGKDGKGKNGDRTELYNLLANRDYFTYEFNNLYKQVDAPKNITIRKLVQEFGGTAFTPEALNKKFDFYIALYRYNGSEYIPLSFEECQKVVNKWKSDYPTGDTRIGGIKDKIPVPMGGSKTVLQYLPRISLKHGESINLKLDKDMYYRILESKDEGYEVAKAVVNNSGHESPITIKEVHINECDYSITEIMDQGKEFTFKNPRITLVPTGLRGDITPYLFSIFGFTMVAGMYLTIRKKKRVEI